MTRAGALVAAYALVDVSHGRIAPAGDPDGGLRLLARAAFVTLAERIGYERAAEIAYRLADEIATAPGRR